MNSLSGILDESIPPLLEYSVCVCVYVRARARMCVLAILSDELYLP